MTGANNSPPTDQVTEFVDARNLRQIGALRAAGRIGDSSKSTAPCRVLPRSKVDVNVLNSLAKWAAQILVTCTDDFCEKTAENRERQRIIVMQRTSGRTFVHADHKITKISVSQIL